MSSNRRLMWDRSAPASPLHSSSSAQQEEHFSSAERSSFKGAGISSWFVPRLCSRRRKAACVTFPREADSVLPGWPSSAFKRTHWNDANAADCGEQHCGCSALLMCCICSRSEALINALDMSRLLLPDIYQAGGEALSPRCSFCRDSTFTLLAAISSRQRGVCSSSTPRLLLFMLRLFTHSVLFSFAFYPGRGWLVGCPLPTIPLFQPSLACINTREFRSVWQAIQTPTRCVRVGLPLLKTHLSVDRGGFSIEPWHVKDFQSWSGVCVELSSPSMERTVNALDICPKFPFCGSSGSFGEMAALWVIIPSNAPQNNLKSYKRIFMEFSENVDKGPRTDRSVLVMFQIWRVICHHLVLISTYLFVIMHFCLFVFITAGCLIFDNSTLLKMYSGRKLQVTQEKTKQK